MGHVDIGSSRASFIMTASNPSPPIEDTATGRRFLAVDRPSAADQGDRQVEQKIEQGREFVRRVEADLGHALTDHIVDLFFDNAAKLGFSDDDCLTVGNAIRTDKNLPPVPKWWGDPPAVDAAIGAAEG